MPPQVTSVARKPLSIAFEEIAADKIVAVDVLAEDEPGRRRRRPLTPPSSTPTDRRRCSPVGRIVLGVTGGIAAYKAIEVCRRLVDAGAHVAPIMTEGATRFVGETTFSALASEPVQTSLFDERRPDPAHPARPEGRPRRWCARPPPGCSAPTPPGISDDLLTATLLATRAPVVVCPAMHTEMWEHPAVQDNLATLRRPGRARRAAREGRLAGGDVGAGRLADPADDRGRGRARSLRRRPTSPACACSSPPAAPARPIDPVRVIANRSSGKQGYALAEAAAARGAKVTLVTTVDRPVPRRRRRGPGGHRGRDAGRGHARRRRPGRDRHGRRGRRLPPGRPPPTRRSRRPTAGRPECVLEPTPRLPRRPRRGQAGRARSWSASPPRPTTCSPTPPTSWRRKHLDLIVANDVSAPGVGFEHDTNQSRSCAATARGVWWSST